MPSGSSTDPATVAAGGAGDGGTDRPADPPRPRTHVSLSIAAALAFAALALHTCVAEPLRVGSASMEPTLHRGDWILVDKLSLRWRPIEAGEVVVLAPPGGGRSLVKRVVALGGQSVALDDGRLVVDGSFVREPYVDESQMAGRYFGPVVVPDDHVFVLGDHRADSEDSRTFGPVPAAAISGRLVATLWHAG